MPTNDQINKALQQFTAITGGRPMSKQEVSFIQQTGKVPGPGDLQSFQSSPGWIPTNKGQKDNPQFELPDFPSQFKSQIDAQNAMWRDLQAQRDQQAREAERKAALQEIDQLLAARTEAENAAIKQVDASLTQQMDKARLLGLDFQIPDEKRLLRISNAFSELFPEEQDTRLVELMSKYGAPGMSEAERQAIEAGDLRFMPDFAIQRTDREGDGSLDEAIAAGGTPPVGGRRGKRRGLLDEEDNQPNVLGI